MAFDKPAHHIGLAARPEGRAAALLGFDLNEPVDDLPAFHEKAVESRVDAIDLLAKIG
jgi:hypothetical protein